MVTQNKKKPEYPCSVCSKNVTDNQLSIECSICKLWSHNKCNKVDKKVYLTHQHNPNLPFYCIKCNEDIYLS